MRIVRSADPRAAVQRQRLDRCTSIEACDRELRFLVGRLRCASLPETTARLYGEIDAVLDRRIALGARQRT